MEDEFTCYEKQVQALVAQLGRDHPRLNDTNTLQYRLLENISRARIYGDNQNYASDRAQALHELNALALKLVGCPLSEIDLDQIPPSSIETPSSSPTAQSDSSPIDKISSFLLKNDREEKQLRRICKASSIDYKALPGVKLTDKIKSLLLALWGERRLHVLTIILGVLHPQRIRELDGISLEGIYNERPVFSRHGQVRPIDKKKHEYLQKWGRTPHAIAKACQEAGDERSYADLVGKLQRYVLGLVNYMLHYGVSSVDVNDRLPAITRVKESPSDPNSIYGLLLAHSILAEHIQGGKAQVRFADDGLRTFLMALLLASKWEHASKGYDAARDETDRFIEKGTLSKLAGTLAYVATWNLPIRNAPGWQRAAFDVFQEQARQYPSKDVFDALEEMLLIQEKLGTAICIEVLETVKLAAVGQEATDTMVNTLCSLVKSKDEPIARRAVLALENAKLSPTNQQRVIDILTHVALNHPWNTVRINALTAQAKLGGNQCVWLFIKVLVKKDKASNVRAKAAQLIGKLAAPEEGQEALWSAICGDKDEIVRAKAVQALVDLLGRTEAVRFLTAYTESLRDSERLAAQRALERLGVKHSPESAPSGPALPPTPSGTPGEAGSAPLPTPSGTSEEAGPAPSEDDPSGKGSHGDVPPNDSDGEHRPGDNGDAKRGREEPEPPDDQGHDPGARRAGQSPRQPQEGGEGAPARDPKDTERAPRPGVSPAAESATVPSPMTNGPQSPTDTPEPRQTYPIVEVEVAPAAIVKGKKTALEIIVQNTGDGEASHLVLHQVSGILEADSSVGKELAGLPPGESAGFPPLQVCPPASGWMLLTAVIDYQEATSCERRRVAFATMIQILESGKSLDNSTGSEAQDSVALAPTYVDFNIVLEAGKGENYTISVPDHGAMHEVVSKSTLLRIVDELGRDPAVGEKRLQALGRNLFDTIFVGSIADAYREYQRLTARAKGLRLRLHLATESSDLHLVPWELLYDPVLSEYLCQTGRSPIVRCPHPKPVAPIDPTSFPLGLLFAGSSPAGPEAMNISGEMELLKLAVQPLEASHLLVFSDLLFPAERSRLKDQIKTCDMFHFAGPGGEDDNGEYILIGTIDKTSSGLHAYHLDDFALESILEDAHVRLAVLGIRREVSDRATDKPGLSPRQHFGLASGFLKVGCPAVLTMQFPLNGPSAQLLADLFYRALAEHRPIEEAVDHVRSVVKGKREAGIPGWVWAAPVLYMASATGDIFPPLKTD